MRKIISRNALSLIISVLIFCLILIGLLNMNRSTQKNAQSSLENAMRRGIMECYAMEGAYPENLSYLEKNYYITYDHQAYKVIYHYNGDQHLPTFKVVRRSSR